MSRPFPRSLARFVRPSEITWYMAGQASYAAGIGAQSVLFAWLITIPLGRPAEAVGFAQMLSMLPMPLLMLAAGAVIERRDLRTHLLQMLLLVMVPQALLAVAILAGVLDYALLLAYGLVTSLVVVFIMPARDAALPAIVRGAGRDLMPAIATATGIQFGAQVAGLVIAGFASDFAELMTGERSDGAGAVPVIGLMCGLIGFAVLATLRIAPQPPHRPDASWSLRDLVLDAREGLTVAFASPQIRPVVLLLFCTSVLFMGTFVVLFPILSRDIYGGGSMKLALTNASFMAGVFLSTNVLARLPPVRRPGRSMMLAMGGSFFALLVIHMAPPTPVLYLTVLAWGVAAGVSMTMSRTIVQEAAPDSHKARLVSIYQLAQMGGAPIGAIAIGYVIAHVGVLNALLVPAVGVVIVLGATALLTNLWQMERGG